VAKVFGSVNLPPLTPFAQTPCPPKKMLPLAVETAAWAGKTLTNSRWAKKAAAINAATVANVNSICFFIRNRYTGKSSL